MVRATLAALRGSQSVESASSSDNPPPPFRKRSGLDLAPEQPSDDGAEELARRAVAEAIGSRRHPLHDFSYIFRDVASAGGRLEHSHSSSSISPPLRPVTEMPDYPRACSRCAVLTAEADFGADRSKKNGHERA